jgi:hypothetical protein
MNINRRSFFRTCAIGLAAAVGASPLSRSGQAKDLVDHTKGVEPASLGVDENLVEFDYGEGFTKRMKEVMKKQKANPSYYWDKGNLSDLYISPEAMEDIKNWSVDQIDEETRKEILSNSSEIAHMHGSSIGVCKDLDREEIHELGRRGPYRRHLIFPVDDDFTEEITMVGNTKSWTEPKEEKPVSSAIDFQLMYCKDARWDVMARAADILAKGAKNA